MYKIVTLLERKENISPEEFIRYWEKEHAPKVLKLPNVRRYTIAPTISSDAPYDGIAELYFDSVSDIRAGNDTEAIQAIRRDEDAFIADTTFFVAEERIYYNDT